MGPPVVCAALVKHFGRAPRPTWGGIFFLTDFITSVNRLYLGGIGWVSDRLRDQVPALRPMARAGSRYKPCAGGAPRSGEVATIGGEQGIVMGRALVPRIGRYLRAGSGSGPGSGCVGEPFFIGKPLFLEGMLAVRTKDGELRPQSKIPRILSSSEEVKVIKDFFSDGVSIFSYAPQL
jgi:hypothetical protein